MKTDISITKKLLSATTVLVLWFAFSTISAQAANWYVRSGAGGDGTSWTSAWNNTTNVIWSSIQPGDTIWFAGGSYGGLTVGKSGNADSDAGRIFIKRATASAHGSDIGWDSGYDSQVTFAIVRWNMLNVGSYVTIDGQAANGIRILVGSGGNSAILFDRGANYVTIRNVELAGPCPTLAACTQGGDNRGLDTTAYNGSSYDQITNLLFQNNKVHGFCTLVWLMNTDASIIENSEFYHSNALDTSVCHPNVMATSQSSNVTFRYNKVYDYAAEGIMYLFGNSGTWYIYGNLWHGNTGYSRILESQDGANGPIYFYNNTIADAYFGIRTANGGSWINGSQERNNIWWNIPGGLGGGGFSDIDYNFCSGSCSGSHTVSSGSNPFVSYVGKNYQIVSTVGATYPRNKGVNLGVIYDTDLFGVARGSDGAWDIGAFESSPSGRIPAPPTSLLVQ